MKPDQPYGMTSREAAALYLSGGATDDPGLASMLDYAKKQPELLIPKGYVGMVDYEAPKLVIDNPDKKERQALRNAIGFDYDVVLQAKRALVTTIIEVNGGKLQTTTKLTGDSQTDSLNIAKAVIRLKHMRERYMRTLSNFIGKANG